jgi:hypothetical protein
MPSRHSIEQYQHGIEILDDRLGPQRRTELNARGYAMNETEATDYALAAIDHAIASEPPTQSGVVFRRD